jgi:hypothetical protein
MTAGLVLTDAAPERALSLLDEALEQATSVGNNLGIGLVLTTSGHLHLTHGEWNEAARLTLRGVEHFYRIGDLNFFRNQMHPAMVVLTRAHADESAAVIYGSTRLGRGVYEGDQFDQLEAPWAVQFGEAAEALKARLGEGRFAACMQRGASMDDDELVSLLRDEVDRLLSAS